MSGKTLKLENVSGRMPAAADGNRALLMKSQSGLKKILSRIPGNIRYALLVIALLLFLNFVLRLAFLLYNTAQAKALHWPDLFTGFFVGIRYDLAVIFLLNGLLFLILTLPIRMNRHRITYRLMNWIILFVNLPVLLVNAIDVIYYGFSEKRLTHELFTTRDDLLNIKIGDILGDFWFMFLLFFALIFLLYKVLAFFAKGSLKYFEGVEHRSGLKYWIPPVIYAILMFIGVRGGLQTRWLSPEMAFVSPSFFAGNLGMNSAWTILSSLDREQKPVYLLPHKEAVQTVRQMVRNDFDTEFVSDEYPLLRKATFSTPERRYNIVILLIESFNASQMGAISGNGFTPFLDSLSASGRLYTHFYSNAVRSIEAMPSLLNSLPEIFSRPSIGSRYENITHWGLGNILGARGYHTSYFHGAENGSLGIDRYARISGFDHYYGMNEYPHSERDFDGLWGVFDQPFLQWTAQTQNTFPEPFVSVFFSCTNHHPFPLPEKGAEDIHALPVSEMEKTVLYTDRALRSYFEEAKKYPWFDSTLFIITGDHCFHLESEPGRAMPDNFHVPFIMIGPEIQPGHDPRLGSQASVLPTVIEYLRLNTYHASTNVSLISEHSSPFVFHNLMGVMALSEDTLSHITSRDHYMPYASLRGDAWHTHSENPVLPSQTRDLMDKQLRSFYQVLHNCRIQDRFVSKAYMNP